MASLPVPCAIDRFHLGMSMASGRELMGAVHISVMRVIWPW
ncbi:hypothetical protein ACP70R_041288 [Stipagrostis hirtigluma subsp. patula]